MVAPVIKADATVAAIKNWLAGPIDDELLALLLGVAFALGWTLELDGNELVGELALFFAPVAVAS